MVKVPRISETRVKKTAPSDVTLSKRVDEEAFGSGASSRVKSRAARGLADDVSKLILQERKKADDAQVNEHSGELAAIEIQLADDRSKAQGKDALQYPEIENAERDRRQNEVFGKITNNRVKRRLRADALSYTISGQKATQKHVAQERDKYEKSSLTASIDNSRILALNTGDDEEIQKAILVNENKLRKFGKDHGMSDKEIEMNVFNEKSRTHAQNIERLMAIDTDVAKEYYNVHKKEIDQATLSKPDLDRKVAAFLKVNFDEIRDDLAEKQIEGKLTPDDILAVSAERSQGGIGAVEAKRWLSIIDNEQSRKITKILKAEKEADEEEAKTYIEMIDNLIDDNVDKFEMKQKLVEFGARIDSEERKVLNNVSKILKDVEFQKKERNFIFPIGIRKSRDQIMKVLDKANFKDSEIKDTLKNIIDFHVEAKKSDPEKYKKDTEDMTNKLLKDVQSRKNPAINKYEEGQEVTVAGQKRKVKFVDGKPTFVRF